MEIDKFWEIVRDFVNPILRQRCAQALIENLAHHTCGESIYTESETMAFDADFGCFDTNEIKEYSELVNRNSI